MSTLGSFASKLAAAARPVLGSRAVRLIAYLGLCAAYLQGGLVKLTDFPGAIAEMTHEVAPTPRDPSSALSGPVNMLYPSG